MVISINYSDVNSPFLIYTYAGPKYFYSLFAIRWMQAGGKELSGELFRMIYQRFNGYTWYIQYVLNRLYEQREPVLNETIFEKCLAGI